MRSKPGPDVRPAASGAVVAGRGAVAGSAGAFRGTGFVAAGPAGAWLRPVASGAGAICSTGFAGAELPPAPGVLSCAGSGADVFVFSRWIPVSAPPASKSTAATSVSDRNVVTPGPTRHRRHGVRRTDQPTDPFAPASTAERTINR